ncbi:MAG: hypothetical protein KBC50_02800 [Candidatus Pacebacteria bacterium]|nr:hypothetical protein [Candidatus Paceibacterota bacterium]
MSDSHAAPKESKAQLAGGIVLLAIAGTLALYLLSDGFRSAMDNIVHAMFGYRMVKNDLTNFLAILLVFVGVIMVMTRKPAAPHH